MTYTSVKGRAADAGEALSRIYQEAENEDLIVLSSVLHAQPDGTVEYSALLGAASDMPSA